MLPFFFGDEIAPALETMELRAKARIELTAAVSSLDAGEKQRLTGLYAAFDPSKSDAVGEVACDDDGDYVIVLSDGMLRLVWNVAHEPKGYASLLARAQVPGQTILPPPPGSFARDDDPDAADGRFREALAFVVATEVAHLRARDLVCPHPTATKEHGDDEWTLAEQRAAAQIAVHVYPGDVASRDRDAAMRTTRGLEGARRLLAFFVEVDGSRFAPTWLTTHPDPAARLKALSGPVRQKGVR